jgi:hypothetical protein
MLVLVDEAVSAGRLHDAKVALIRPRWRIGPEWWSLIESTVGPVGVVVVDVVHDESFELVLVPDDGAVEELASHAPDPSFSERVGHGCADGGLEDLHSLGSEDLIEGVDERHCCIVRSPEASVLRIGPARGSDCLGELFERGADSKVWVWVVGSDFVVAAA